MAERIGKKDFQEKVTDSTLPVVVDFYSDSCVACKMLAPAFGEAEDVLGQKVLFYKVNTNFDQELTEEYGILANPTLIFFLSGKEFGRRTGAMKPEELIEWLETGLEESHQNNGKETFKCG